ncbi:phospholipid/glycerol acyltransferase [Paraglaciecola sp. T6c]|uniref:lysophospholipid acyltransferase family protein n=1 Tax=Pseudoalteromonas atlantica (strain T6c / ATCC BAA-1087) TaxID=3042615 RepID=UPI00005C5BD0|nr:GNAT family N-acyltransferase [Paraglaciecola sp. T6c]ABG39112.1 phospholipid/glycerol acyltransferase [Paraglaciecola sp. T6c]
MTTAITLLNLVPQEKQTAILTGVMGLLDKLLAIHRLDHLYREHHLTGLNKEAFAKALLEALNVTVEGTDVLQKKVPQNGPLVIASNHPFGGIEGVILAYVIGQIRPDLKVLANQGLALFTELKDYFIFTNPLSERDPKNAPSLRESLRHVKQGGALLIFPAGRVSYYQADKKRISEHQWNRIVANLVTRTGAQYLALFVSGENSPLFYHLGRVYYRLRMLMLPRELLNKRDTSIKISAATCVPANAFAANTDDIELSALQRIQSYTQDPTWRHTWPASNVVAMQPLISQVPGSVINTELAQLDESQTLLSYRNLDVYYAYYEQIPQTVKEIARLRELVFREHDEGSGNSLDTDDFDKTYTHLFIVERDLGRIIGAYRMGQSDRLLANASLNIDPFYLSAMFNFSADFINRQAPCLEMGRSFLIPEYQNSFQGLLLLWRGIGRFVCQFPQYRTLYGTVSLSKLYDPRSVSLIEHALVTPTRNATARTQLGFSVPPEIADFAKQYPLKKHLTSLLAGIESDGKDVPILLKHYQKLGAKFHCLGIDSNFNHTPGLLLSVELAKAPEKLGRLYLGDGWKAYKCHQENQ